MNFPGQSLADLLFWYRAQSAPDIFRFTLFWGMLLLGALILGLTSYHVHSIPENLDKQVRQLLADRPWVSRLVVVDGRDILLVGEVEPGSGIESSIDMIARIKGIRDITNRLSEQPKPSAHFVLSRNGRNLEMSGRMTGDDQATVAEVVRNTFPDHSITDRINVDDRLGRPLWLDGFSKSLAALKPVGSFDLNGWKDYIDVTGTTANNSKGLRTGYAMPAALSRRVSVRNRLAPETAIGLPIVNITSDWRGLHIEGTVSSNLLKGRLVAACRSAFGAEQISYDISVDPVRSSDNALKRVIMLFPALAKVRNLRLISSGDGFMVWGEVDTPRLLGNILNARYRLGLEPLVSARIEVAPATKPATLALFSDQTRAIASGVLPSIKAKEVLFRTIADRLQVEKVVDLVSIEPDVAQSDWLDSLNELLALAPKNILGITIDDQNLLLTGTVENQDHYDKVNIEISKLFPDIKTINWLVPADN